MYSLDSEITEHCPTSLDIYFPSLVSAKRGRLMVIEDFDATSRFHDDLLNIDRSHHLNKG